MNILDLKAALEETGARRVSLKGEAVYECVWCYATAARSTDVRHESKCRLVQLGIVPNGYGPKERACDEAALVGLMGMAEAIRCNYWQPRSLIINVAAGSVTRG